MTLTVEDGTGLTTADALISLAWFKAWCDARGKDYSAYTDDEIEQAIRRGTEYMSDSHHWAGLRVKERGHSGGMQTQAWPRIGVVDRNGYSVDDASVPGEVQRATAEVSFYELGTPGGMQPSYVAHDRVVSETVGPLSTTYDLSSIDAQGARPVLLAVRDLIGQFLAAGTGNRLSGATMRG